MSPLDKKLSTALRMVDSNPKEAERMLSKLLKLHPDNPAVRRCYGHAKVDLFKNEEAYEIFAQLVTENPLHELDSIILFVILCRLSRFDEAYEEVDRFVSATGSFTPNYDLALSEMRDEIDDEEYDRRAEEIDRKKNIGLKE